MFSLSLSCNYFAAAAPFWGGHRTIWRVRRYFIFICALGMVAACVCGGGGGAVLEFRLYTGALYTHQMRTPQRHAPKCSILLSWAACVCARWPITAHPTENYCTLECIEN